MKKLIVAALTFGFLSAVAVPVMAYTQGTEQTQTKKKPAKKKKPSKKVRRTA